MSTAELTLLERREIEAQIVGPLLRAFEKEFGPEPTRSVAAGVIRELARSAGCAAAEALGGNGTRELAEAVEHWRAGGALSLVVIRADEDAVEFNVTRCRFAEMYRRLGLEDLGAVLSCDRDGAMVEGFNPDLELTRTQTLMQGATHCDFRYRRRG
jgi:hypothetical protein